MLGKDEPHPVASFPARTKLEQGLLENAAGLRLDKARQIEGIGAHGISSAHNAPNATRRRPKFRTAARLDDVALFLFLKRGL
jgi:hypothetical protein